MFENENLVTEEVAENTVQTAEETPEKTYTEAEFNAKLDEVLGKKIARNEAKIRKEYERRYRDLEEVLEAGMGKKNSVEEMTDSIRKAYEKQGVKISKKPDYTEQDIETLATADANEFISNGFEDVIEEAERLKNIGAENMTPRERATFKKLAAYVKAEEQRKNLAKIGVAEDVYESREFKDFKKKFAADTPIEEIYDIYSKTKPKKEIKTMGSMKNNTQSNGIKDYYSPEEARKFTQAEINSNPALVDAIERSMLKWK